MDNAGNQDEESPVLGVAWTLPKERPGLRVKIISAIPIGRSRSLVRPVTSGQDAGASRLGLDAVAPRGHLRDQV